MVCLEQVTHDVKNDLLVGIELRILAGEKGLRVGRAGNRFLGKRGYACHEGCNQNNRSEIFFHVRDSQLPREIMSSQIPKELAANYADYANGHIKDSLMRPFA